MDNLEQSKNKAKEFLSSESVGVLSSLNSDGTIHGSAVYFVVDNDYNIYFVTRTNTQKYKNATENMSVAFTVYSDEGQETIQVRGISEPVKDKAMIDKVFQDIEAKSKHPKYWPPAYVKVDGGDFGIVKIKPKSMRYADFHKFSSEPGDHYFTNIIED